MLVTGTQWTTLPACSGVDRFYYFENEKNKFEDTLKIEEMQGPKYSALLNMGFYNMQGPARKKLIRHSYHECNTISG